MPFRASSPLAYRFVRSVIFTANILVENSGSGVQFPNYRI
jgi:hypothetical protein